MCKNIKQSKQYKEFRYLNLKTACERCGTVRHDLVLWYKIPPNVRPELLLEPSNVQTVCPPCYQRMYIEKRNQFMRGNCDICGSDKRLGTVLIDSKSKRKSDMNFNNVLTICRKCHKIAKANQKNLPVEVPLFVLISNMYCGRMLICGKTPVTL